MKTPYFLPYQRAWLDDAARFKVWQKSRRIGATYVQAYEDVRDAARAQGATDVWFSSADQSAAREYIDYCAQWARLFDVAARELGEVVIDAEHDIKAYIVQLANGRKITGLSSNPKAFRSKGGKLVLDEFAFHADAEALWRAARPIVTWGYPVRVLSTHNGRGGRFYRMVSDAEKAEGPFSLHTVTIEDAVAQGLADKIAGRALDEAGRRAWLAEQRAACGDEETWLQEYMCVAVDEATAWLTWELIVSAEHGAAGDPARYEGGPCYVGVDIARRRDLFIIWVAEQVGDVLWSREIVRLKNASFATQDAALARVFAGYDVMRCCMDQTGIGEKPVEDAKRNHGAYRVEGVLFTGPAKQHLATIIRQSYEDRKVRTPEDRAVREAHHAVRKVTTAAGNPRFDAERTEAGHADEFWAHALALHAAESAGQGRWRPTPL
ncbi:MAG: terminase large subunit domain-containing protein, partial [Kiloniellaceae bacterium]